ncbi:MAG: CHAT domain-containing protein [Pirellulales bacterium]
MNTRSLLQWVLTTSLFAAMVLTAGVGAADERADRTAFDRLNQQWIALASAGQYREAAEVGEQMLVLAKRSAPEFVPAALAVVGDSLARIGRFKEAAAYHQECIELLSRIKPTSEAFRLQYIQLFGIEFVHMGQCHRLAGDYTQAVDCFKNAITWGNKFGLDDLLANATAELAQAYSWLSEFELADATFRQGIELQERLARNENPPGHRTSNLARDYNNWGNLYRSRGRYDVAESLYRHALKLAVSADGWEHPNTAAKLHNLSVVCYEHGQFADAESYVRQAMAIREKILGPDDPQTIDSVAALGRVATAFGQHQEAEKLLRRAVDSYAKFVPGTTAHAVALRHLADAIEEQNKPDEAETALEQALAILEKTVGPTHEQYVATLLELAHVRGRVSPEATLEVTDRVERIHAQVPLSPVLLADLYRVQAIVAWATNQKPKALQLLAKSIEQVELERSYSSGAERERADLFSTFAGQYELMVEWQAESGDVAGAFAAIENVRARTYLEELQLKGLDLLDGIAPEERARLLARETQLRQALTEAETQLANLPDLGPAPEAPLLAQRKEAVQAVLIARQRLYDHSTEIKKASPAYRQLLSGDRQTITLADVQQSLVGEGELLLSYQLASDRSYVVVIRPHEARVVELTVDEPSAKTLGIEPGRLTRGDLVRILQDEKQGVLPALARPDGANQAEQLAALWKVLIPSAEVQALVDGSIKRLVIVPDGPLALLPFEALVTSAGDDPQYLLDVGPPIAYAPSAAVLANLARRESPAAVAGGESILALGDPSYPQVAARTDAVDRALGLTRSADLFRAGLSRLPFTGWEANWVQQMFDKAGMASTKLIGPRATEAAIRREAPGRTIIHLACHGMADQNYGNFFGTLAVTPGNAGDPADDGFLSMSEIYQLNLAGCELAILSACETNYGPQQQGEGVWALSRGFLVAGARRVVASNWVVDDEAGATLVSFFASYLAERVKAGNSRDYAQALHDAKKQVRKEQKWANPFYWSSLVLVGPR